jgi:TPR repeat protein
MYDHGFVPHLDGRESAPDNRAEAARLWKLAAEQGIAGAQFNLGAMFESGRGVALDTAEAVRWYLLAAASETGGHGRELAVRRLQLLGL